MLLHHPSYIESRKALFGLALKKILQKFNQMYLIKKANNVLEKCVVPENIQTPPRREFHFGPPPPTTQDFPFLQGTDDPPPPRNFHKCDKDPNPSGKVYFHEERLFKQKNEAIYGQYATVSIRSLYTSVSIYLSDLATLKHTTPPQSNLIRNFCSSLTLNETEKVNKSVIFVNLP